MLPRARAAARATLDEVFELFPQLRSRVRQAAAGTLSGGEQQMLAIGRCLMGAAGADHVRRALARTRARGRSRRVRDHPFAARERGLTIVLVEQNVATILKMADRAYVLENGQIVLSGSGRELLDDSRVRSAYLGM